MKERLQKILAQAGLASRRRAEEMILSGRVKVNGEITLTLGQKADPACDLITLDGQKVKCKEDAAYFMFHKPVGYLTALADPYGRPTVKIFLDKLPVRVYPVGRLDKDVSGILILTNDGELARRLMHPSFEVPKVYWVKVKGQLRPEDLLLLSSGRLFIDGKKAAPAQARLVARPPENGWLELILTEGRHRQVKKMCAAVGHPVEILKRVAYASLPLDPKLKAGEIRPLKTGEIKTLKDRVNYDQILPKVRNSDVRI
ncbi:MAG: rRNA pseudouridine synthase [Deltaproteobacteria bacterium]|jgi:23S rRNA pseudouridine2605 synthase|nr:rRNA pseudouridine synthase [Deltaproteobacteria bacterium]